MSALIVSASIGLGVMIALLITRRVLLSLLRGWALRRASALEEVFFSSLKNPSLLWCVVAGIYAGLRFSDFPEKYISVLDKTAFVLLLFSITISASNLAGRLFRYYVRTSQREFPLPTTGLTYALIKVFVLVSGFLMILHSLGVSILPLLTALGVGGLAVALALQDTLSNLFAGIQILVEKTVRVGDFIRLEQGQEGYIIDIGLRTTRVRLLTENILVVPNNKITQNILTNFHLPEKVTSFPMTVPVSYDSDPEKAESALLEVVLGAAGSREIPGLLEKPAPYVRFGFGAHSMEFTVYCYVGEYMEQYPVQGELRKRILKKFREEGIKFYIAP